jgi:inorganic triphosphatase YgiF
MHEQEIKLAVPADTRKAVADELTGLGAQRIRLCARYYDTPDRQLARCDVSLRLRLEGRHWVQTLKQAGQDSVTRVELNHPRTAPQLDLSVYAGTPAEGIIRQLKGELGLRYETNVWRLKAELRTPDGVAEAAYDEGTICAGDLELPLHELELELMSGTVDTLFTLAKAWTARHRLVLDARSKAERGDRLAKAAAAILAAPDADRATVRQSQIETYWAPTMASRRVLSPRATPSQALDVVTAECLDQVVRNATALSGIDGELSMTAINAKHVHQLRIGLRRLRSAWRLFKGWAPLPGDDAQKAAADFFGQFGQARDSDVLNETVVPLLSAAGMQPVDLGSSGEGVDAATVAASAPFQGWLLELLAWNVGLRDSASAIPSPVVAVPLRPAKLEVPVVRRLKKWHKELVEEGSRFHLLEDEARHDLRKLAKRLRYGLSFTESLFDADHVKPYLKSLATLQDVLGNINDLVVARETYRELSATQPTAWFAVGWLSAKLEALYDDAETQFAALGDTRPFWK